MNASGSEPRSASPVAHLGVLAGRYRWVICAILFFGVTNNYMDRQILGVLKRTLQGELGWNEIDYSNLVTAFQAAYATGMLLMGRLMDKLGTRLGYAIAITTWSLAAMAHSFAATLFGFGAARVALGLGESGVFPGSIKTIAEWFPKRERALATGIFNAGTNVGAILTPIVVAWILNHFTWRMAFLLVGVSGFFWLAVWLALVRHPQQHSRVTPEELAHIQSDPPEATTPISWFQLFPHRQTWAVALAKFCADPIWWFYLFWMPDFLQRTHNLTIAQLAVPLAAIYLISDVGSVAGGWFSSWLIKRGSSINFARKITMLVCALCVIPILGAYYTKDLWTAVLLVGLAAAAHQGFSANVFTIASDTFPTRAVGSVIGIGGFAGAVGGMFIAKIVGYVLQKTGSYFVPFVMAGCAYLLALAIVHLLIPRLDPARV